ncbi:MAG: putative lipid II flippase FtsW [Clostridia bacterium]|nr:putative lipid II flippase FtsW [Clostridia bacterium]
MANRELTQGNIAEFKPKKTASKMGGIDFTLLFTVLLLLVIGLTMLFSASSAANMTSGNVYSTIIKQSLLAAVGIVMMLIISMWDYKKIKKLANKLYFIFDVVLMLLVPFIGIASHGATRQLDLGFISFQPSEFSKYFLIIALAARFSGLGKKKSQTWFEFAVQMVYILVPTIICAGFQSHLSAAIIHIAVGLVMMIAAGIKWKKMAVILGGAGVGGILLVLSSDYRRARVLSFFQSGGVDIQGRDWQSTQSSYAVGSGGLFGLGLGNSRQKYSYLPEAENDYIFAIVAEELGFVGTVLIILLYCVLIWRGITIAVNCKDSFGSYLAFGITVLIGLQTLINMGVVLQLLPSTGMQLPLFSSGGTSLVITLMGFGLLLSVSRQTKL